MADLSVTAADVVAVSGSTVTEDGTAGATITAGQVVYKDTTDSNKLKLADASAEATAAVCGVAMHGATSGQPLKYAVAGSLTFSTMTVGETYQVSATAGAIAPVADISTNYVSFVGYASTATNLVLMLRASGITHA